MKKKILIILSVVIVLFVTIFFSIKSVNDNKNIVYLETETVKMLQNDTYVISPDDSRLKDTKMIYRSSDEKIAEITKDGKIISKNEGTANTAKSGYNFQIGYFKD